MPFLGQDWRSPGEQWVRTPEGWERLKLWRLKLLQNINQNVITRLLKLDDLMRYKDIEGRGIQPYVYVVRPRVSKEVAVHTSTGEALSRLEFGTAVTDPRRFNYVCKLVEDLVEYKLGTLSGGAQKLLMKIMEAIVETVLTTENNVNRAQSLLTTTRRVLKSGQYDHLGSSALWAHHTRAVNNMQARLDAFTLTKRDEDGKVMLTDLPDDVIRVIFSRFNDHGDLERCGQINSHIQGISEENSLWRSLCEFHFASVQYGTVLQRGESLDTLAWKTLYNRLVKRYGMREVFARMLHQCKHCHALYWEDRGHPCPYSEITPKSVVVSPLMCVKLFTS